MLKVISLCALAALLSACADLPQIRESAPVTDHDTTTRQHRVTLGEQRAAGTNERRERILSYHAKWEGTPHQLGGQSPLGVDCSGYMVQTFRDVFGYSLPRTTQAQARLGQSVSVAQLQDGDLVFFKTGRSQGHVGVYVGNGQFAHSSDSLGVTISSLDDIYWKRHYWQSRRLL